LEIKLKKLIKPDCRYFYQSEMNKDFKFVEAEICNVSSSSILIKDLELDSSDSNLLYLLLLVLSNLNNFRFNC